MSPSRGPWRDAYRFNDSREYYTDRQDYDDSGYSYGGSRRSAATPGGERNYNYRRGYHHTAPRYDQEESWPQRQRRASPVYEDYAGPSSSVTSGPSSSPVHGEYSAPASPSSAPSRPPSSRRSQPPRNEPQRLETSPPLPPSYDYAREEYQESSYSSYTAYSDRRGERMRFAPPPPRPRRSASPESQSQNLILRGPSISLRVSPLRSPTPPPSRKTAPTEEYLSASLQPSTRIPDPTQERKLIVLDLNGSLLLRSQHKPRYHAYGAQGGGKPFNPYDPSIPPIQRGLRTVHPRPYLSPFISYLFHPETKKWLDTMVWSSAQPHSVDDMVQKCFKERRGELKAVWARDTLGLTGNEYNQKTQTTKDLEKPWSSLFSTSQSASSPFPLPLPAIEAPPKPTQHSAKSTLLVDDSPLKAILQPWNHLCIQEYTQELRRVDLETVDREWEQRERVREALMRERKEEREKEKERKMLERLGVSVAPWEETGAGSDVPKSAAAGEGEGEGEGEVEKGEEGEGEETAEKKLNSAARRKLKRLAKKHEARLSSATTASLPSSSSFLNPTEGEGEKIEVGVGDAGEEVQAQTQPKEYDTTLLAVIGILDHLKCENNVAGWMRAGGLLGVPGVPASVSVPLPAGAGSLEEGEISSAAAAASEIIQTVLGLEGTHTPPTLEEQGREKRRRVSGAEEGAGVASPEAAEAEAEIQEYEEQALTGVPTSSSEHEHEHNLSKSEKGSAHEPKPHPHPQLQLQSELEAEAEQPPSAAIAPLWYEHPAAQAYWAQRGREALLALGIEVESGIERVPGGLQ